MLLLPKTLNHAEAASSPPPSSSASSLSASSSSTSGDWLAQARAANWQIDASELAQFDSSALALLLDLQRSAVASQSKLVIHHAPARLTQLAVLYGVNELIA
jgi:phospholipid transport system transporter-binding protein